MLPFLALLLILPQDTLRLSLDDAMALARTNNTRYLREQLRGDNATLSMANARARRYYPSVSMHLTAPAYTSRLSRQSSIDDQGQVIEQIGREERRSLSTEISLSQPLPTGGTLRISGEVGSDNQPLLDSFERYNGATAVGISLSQQFFGVNNSIRDYRVAKENYARSQAQLIDEERDIARSVLEVYFDLVQARKQAEIDSMIYLRDSMRIAESAVGPAGSVAGEVDSLKFELEAARSAFNKARSRQDVSEAQARLLEVLALPLHTVVITDTVLHVERFVPDVEKGLASAYANRYDLRLAQMGVENRRAGLGDARRTSPITLSLNTTLGFNGSGSASRATSALQDAIDRQSSSRQVNVGISVPLFDRFAERNAVARARNDLRSAELSLADERRQLENEVRLAAQQVTIAGTQLDLAERQVDITRRTMDLQTQRYASGQINSVEFLIDQESARTAEIGLLEAQVDMLIAVEDWRRAIGERSLISAMKNEE